jgi:hypothetical protein
MTSLCHRIRKQTIEFILDEGDAREVQLRFGELYLTKIVPGMDQIFSDLCDPEQVVKIERIEIDLGNISLDQLETDFAKKVLCRLQDEVSAKIRRANLRDGSEGDLSVPARCTSSESREVYAIMAGEDALLQAFRHFLETGLLPWWSGIKSSGDLHEAFINLLGQRPDGMRFLLEWAVTSETARIRLIYQLPEPLLRNVIEILIPRIADETYAIVMDLRKVFDRGEITGLDIPKPVITIWNAVFSQFAHAEVQAIPAKEMLVMIVESIVDTIRMPVHELLTTIARAADILHIDSLSRLLHGEVEGIGQGLCNAYADKAEEKPISPTMDDDFTQGNEIQQEKYSCRTDEDPPDSSVKYGEDAASLGIAINNAGIVLLWPYLRHFFEKTGLMKAGKFVNTDSARRAVGLLQYCANGEEETAEFILPLNKLLCGCDICSPVERLFEISAAERLESDKLLEAVIANWQALKNTTIEGFRSAFLQREGLLTEKKRGWLMQVDRRAHDVLLEHLPWGISLVKLSWMPKPLIVQW